MKKFAMRCLALSLSAAVLFSLTACGGEENTPTGESSGASELPTAESTAPESVPAGESDTAPSQVQESGAGQDPAQPAQARGVEQPDIPSTKAEILTLYTEVMNKAKREKPAYQKIEYQEITDRNFDSGAVNTVLKLAGLFMTTEEKATKNPEKHEKGADVTYFPVYEGSAGCLIDPADADKAIEKASCRELQNGNYEIVITLKPETNPEPLVSYHGQMFSPISKKVIDQEIENLGVIKAEYYSVTYHDCTATLVFNPNNHQIVSLGQKMYCLIEAKGAIDMIVHFDIDGNATLENTLQITNFQY